MLNRKQLATLMISAVLTLGAVNAANAANPGGGPWISRGHNGGEVVNVEDGRVVQTGGGEKGARKVARALNKADKKDGKGVMDDGSGNCDSPLYNC